MLLPSEKQIFVPDRAFYCSNVFLFLHSPCCDCIPVQIISWIFVQKDLYFRRWNQPFQNTPLQYWHDCLNKEKKNDFVWWFVGFIDGIKNIHWIIVLHSLLIFIYMFIESLNCIKKNIFKDTQYLIQIERFRTASFILTEIL